MKLLLSLLLLLPAVIAGQVFTLQLPIPFFNIQLKTITATLGNSGQASSLTPRSSQSSVITPAVTTRLITSTRSSATPSVRSSTNNIQPTFSPAIRTPSNRNYVPSIRSSTNDRNRLTIGTRSSTNELQPQESIAPISIVPQNALTNSFNALTTTEPQEPETPGNVARQASLLMSRNRNGFNTVSSRTSSRTNTGGPSCVTPEGDNGRCGHVSECNLYMPYMDLMDQPNVLSFFRDRVCRLMNMEMHVCCPSSPFAKGPTLRNAASVIPKEKDCGNPSTNRLVGGEEVSVGSWPWLVSIGLLRSNTLFTHICGGTLITRRHVLTAAHCFARETRIPIPIHVRLGVYDLWNNNGTSFQQRRIIGRNTLRYRNTTRENDIEIMTLDEDAIFNDFVRPACLPIHPRDIDNDFIGEQVTLVGWGRTTLGTGRYSLTRYPRQVDLPVVTLETCRELYSIVNVKVDNRTLCAGVMNRDYCRGDSGGPLNYLNKENGRIYVVGIVSDGIGCAAFPGVYTRVGAYINWILNNLE